MRRLPATAAAAVALLIATAGCSGGADPVAAPTGAAGSSAAGSPGAGTSGTPGTPGGTPTPGGAEVTATAGGNAGDVCAAAVETSSEAAVTFVNELSSQLQASSTGDTKTAETAKRNAQAALDRWADGIRKQAQRATDPQLRAALTDVSAEIATIEPDVQSLDQSKLDQLQQRVDALCGS
ncbi:hypothetical protein [Plantactinospora sp. KBS50]|uniref:hypothetical protein n=1 Tax=Plantactinospora sp. KBS50 TaxID=2024580 RepID=UPI000BAB0D42|nr:hypothetical protein [Plantactinospora sp. KBS50]ASW56282.1 hypothetical protein CIK06_22155 [Plantactinospora sp. KBS50]